jgi:hypothetical protein
MKEMIRWQANPKFKVDRSSDKPSILEELRTYQSLLEKEAQRTKDALMKFCKTYPFFYWIEETQAMRMVDGMLNENKDLIFTIIVDLV